jgi:hypothetical protein
MEPEHTWPGAQALPQALQWLLSVVRSRQVPVQFVRPAAQLTWQAPLEQTCPGAQAVPQAPQFARSFCVSRQTPVQLVVPAPQLTWQLPAEHT